MARIPNEKLVFRKNAEEKCVSVGACVRVRVCVSYTVLDSYKILQTHITIRCSLTASPCACVRAYMCVVQDEVV